MLKDTRSGHFPRSKTDHYISNHHYIDKDQVKREIPYHPHKKESAPGLSSPLYRKPSRPEEPRNSRSDLNDRRPPHNKPTRGQQQPNHKHQEQQEVVPREDPLSRLDLVSIVPPVRGLQDRSSRCQPRGIRMGLGAREEGGSRSSGEKKRLMYGELVVIGFNGCIPDGDRGRRRSRYKLYKRPQANGVKPAREHKVKRPEDCKVVQDKEQHSVSFTFSRNTAVVVEYTQDNDTDMFQIGRSSEDQIDFIVLDTVPGHLRNPKAPPPQSTISRYACRILVDRKPPYTARIYAAGFDGSANIVLGEKATKWYQDSEIDGLTTNGVLIQHPQGVFAPGCRPGLWREASVGGGLYTLRDSRSQPQKSKLVEDEENILTDGTVIDLCGATLVWRSALSLMSSPSRQELETQVAGINAKRPQCPVGLTTLVLPSSRAGLSSPPPMEKQPFVYLSCGHVHGLHQWEGEHPGLGAENHRTCPMCRKTGPFVMLRLGCETSMYVDCAEPSHCFIPCGHMASEATVRYWSNIPIPHGCHGFRAVCPFCSTPISGTPGYVKLIFQDQSGY